MNEDPSSGNPRQIYISEFWYGDGREGIHVIGRIEIDPVPIREIYISHKGIRPAWQQQMVHVECNARLSGTARDIHRL